ncbi:tail fiber domain-containing protein [Candidatus Liberibacter brunswickensis]
MQSINPYRFSVPIKHPTPIANIDYSKIAQDAYKNKLLEWNENQKELYDTINTGVKLMPIVSDRRMKRDIKPVANLYQYRYLSDPKNIQRIGVIAQEINKIRPDFIIENNQGIQSVDYGRLFNVAKIKTKNKTRFAQQKFIIRININLKIIIFFCCVVLAIKKYFCRMILIAIFF